MTKPDPRTGRPQAAHGSVNGEHTVSFLCSTDMRDALNRAADATNKSRSTIIREGCELILAVTEHSPGG